MCIHLIVVRICDYIIIMALLHPVHLCLGGRMERSEGVTEWYGKDIEVWEREYSLGIPFPAT